ncbi:MAG: MFS transporter, partial [Leptospiraceae bacterium]|nr:MFS transporter [Leptospiraceae bacterium]
METDKRAYRVLFFAWLGWFVNFADRQLIGPLLPLLQKEFNLSNTDIGLLTSAFFIGYSISPIPGGYLADRFGSKKVIAFSVLFFGITTYFTGLVGGVMSLLVTRAFTGLFEGAYYSSAVGYVTSVFPKAKRAFASAIFSTGWTLGSFVGILFATAVGLLAWNFTDALFSVFQSTSVEVVSGDWRSPWMWMIIPTTITAILTYFFMPEIPMQERAAFKEAEGKAKSHGFSEILKNKNAWIIFSLQFVANFGLWSISTFTPKY